MKKDIKEWNKKVFGRLKERKAKSFKRLEELDVSELGVPVATGNLSERDEILRELECIANAEETSWRHKSRLWIQKGDKTQVISMKL